MTGARTRSGIEDGHILTEDEAKRVATDSATVSLFEMMIPGAARDATGSRHIDPDINGMVTIDPHVCYEVQWDEGASETTTYVCKYCGQDNPHPDELASVGCGDFRPNPIASASNHLEHDMDNHD